MPDTPESQDISKNDAAMLRPGRSVTKPERADAEKHTGPAFRWMSKVIRLKRAPARTSYNVLVYLESAAHNHGLPQSWDEGSSHVY